MSGEGRERREGKRRIMYAFEHAVLPAERLLDARVAGNIAR